MNLKNKVALITGGARMGAVIGAALANMGCRVAFSYYKSRNQAAKAVRQIQEQGGQSAAFQGDLTKRAAARRIVKNVMKTWGQLNILVNMASLYGQTPWSHLNEHSWRKYIDANLSSAYFMGLEAAPHLRKEGGRIINISDWIAASERPRYKHYLPYFTAKSGVLGLTQSQALELAPRILVNAIAPGPIIPPSDLTNKEHYEVLQATPLGRWGGAEEIAKAVLFLCDTDFVTGECIRVDGGRHLY